MDELPPQARRLLEVARTLDDPEPERRARADGALRNALAAHGVTNLPPLAASSLQAAPAPVSSGLSLATKLALGVGAVALVAAGFWQLRAAPEPKPAAPIPPPSAAQGQMTYRAAEQARGPELARPALAGAGAAEGRTVHRVASAKPAVSRKVLAADDAALRAELQLLAAVDGMLRSGRHREALRTLADSEGAGSSVLAEERRALRVLALCGAGHAAAHQEREQFLARAPRSVLAERVRATCAVEP